MILDKLPASITGQMAKDVLVLVDFVKTSDPDEAEFVVDGRTLKAVVAFCDALCHERAEARRVLKRANLVLRRNDNITTPSRN